MNKRISAKLSAFVFIVFAGVAGLGSSLAQGTDKTTANKLFYQANSVYKEGKYDLAVENYEEIIKLGMESGNLYYNLGNSYFKKGEFGLALLNYERAKLFIPDDSDLKSNYDYACSLLNLGPQPFGNWLERWVGGLFKAAPVNLLTIFLSLIYCFLALSFILHLFFNRLRRLTRALFFILITLFILSALALQNKITYFKKSAIVISKEADVKFEPFENATTYFKLAEGSRVAVIEKTENWHKIRRFDGKIGWVDKETLGLIADKPAVSKI